MSSVVLTLLKLGIEDLVHFDFMDPPAPETLMRALELLHYLGALDDGGELTPFGYQMSDLPIDPQLSKVLIASATDYNCSNEIATIVACLSVPQIFIRPKESGRQADDAKAQFINMDSDHITLLNAYEAYESVPEKERKNWCWENFLNERSLISATNVRYQLLGILKKLDLPVVKNDGSLDNIRLALSSGMFMQVAFKKRDGNYMTIKDNQTVSIHPSSVVDSKSEWVLYEEFALTTKNYIRTVTKSQVDWLIELAPHYFDLENFPECEAKAELELAYRRLAHRNQRS